MKLFSFILSVVVFFISLYFFVAEMPYIITFNDAIYASLLVILMAICITGVIINWEIFTEKRKARLVLFVSNGFSKIKK
jgi:predicted membrane channel-forming protein YqfA (hemolysin III family)